MGISFWYDQAPSGRKGAVISDWSITGWVPFLTAGLLGVLGSGLYAVHRHRQRTGARAYRQRFVQLVTQLDTVTKSINELAANVRGVKDAKVLDYYEGTLRILETLLGAMRKIAPFGTDVGALNSAVFPCQGL